MAASVSVSTSTGSSVDAKKSGFASAVPRCQLILAASSGGLISGHTDSISHAG